MRGWCPDCDVLHEITATGLVIEVGKSASWKRLVVHRRRLDGEWVICQGSGKLI